MYASVDPSGDFLATHWHRMQAGSVNEGLPPAASPRRALTSPTTGDCRCYDRSPRSSHNRGATPAPGAEFRWPVAAMSAPVTSRDPLPSRNLWDFAALGCSTGGPL